MLLEGNDYNRSKILNALYEDPELVLLLKEKYVDDEIWKFCIEREPSLFKKMKHPSESVCYYAIEIDGSNLRHIRNKFSYILITDRMVYSAVKSNPKAILYVPKKFLNDTIKEMAVDNDPSLMVHFDDIREEYLENIISTKPFAIKYIKNPDEDLICDALIEDPNICVYLNNITDKMIKTLEMYHPNYFALYKNSNQSIS